MEDIKMMVFAIGMPSLIPLTAVVFKVVAKVLGLKAVDRSVRW